MPSSDSTVPFVSRIRLSHFRSIDQCDVALGPLVFVVGRNGSGKSNFIDALRFVADGLRETLDYALERRGGIFAVRQRSKTRPFDFTIDLDLNLPGGGQANYRFALGTQGDEFCVKSETCDVRHGGQQFGFQVQNGMVTSGPADAPAAGSDRLYLVTASGFPQFRPLFDQLSTMAFYNLSPALMREPIAVDSRSLLLGDGRNIGAAFARIEKIHPGKKQRIEEYLSAILPGLTRVERYLIGSRESVEFTQNGWNFEAEQMSDGTLRALGVLTAVLGGAGAPLVGVEEPEIALHPAAFGVLRDALREGSEAAQVIVTSQSPDLLDDADLTPEQILAVALDDNGLTRIGPLDNAGTSMLRGQLCTVGELVRQDKALPALP